MPTFEGGVVQGSGIPLGGLGTGSVEIRPDGYFHEWQVFNLDMWAPRQPDCCQVKPPVMDPGDLAFLVRTQQDDDVKVRRLGARADQQNLYCFAWAHSVAAIEFDGRFPIARLTYRDADLPVAVSAEMFSPFVPHDARTSGTPGFYAAFSLRNRSDRPVTASLMGALKNPLAWHAEDRKLRNSVAQAGGTTFLTFRTGAEGDCRATVGSLGMSVAGGEASWVAGEYDLFMGTFAGTVSAWSGTTHDSMLHRYREAGRLPSLRGGRDPSGLLQLTDEQIDALPPGRRKALLGRLMQYPFAYYIRQRLEELDGRSAVRTPRGQAALLKAVRGQLDWVRKSSRWPRSWGGGALASSVTLQPGESAQVWFTVGWHFPHHFSQKGYELGHMYEHWFGDAEEVNRFLASGRRALAAKVRRFAGALYDTTLEADLADAWGSQLATLAKCTWWIRNGDFAVWEGLGCCGFHTTDITYQGSFNILALFPELQKRQMVMGSRFQRADGRVHHFFTPDLSSVDKGFDRVDMNQQFVLLVCRDWLWTADRGYLRRLWPNIVRALDNIGRLDADGDGLPDHDTRRNTYDCWNFFGTPSYIAGLYLAALKAGIRLAGDLHEPGQAQKWRRELARGVASFDRKLFNGEYYSLWVDGKTRDECCMTDQVDGDWFAELIGLGGCLPAERVRAALAAVFRYNYRPEEGLLNATYPPGRRRRAATYRNVQASSPWTGIEYAIASMMMEFGMFAQGRQIVRTIHRRYERAGRFWKHIECGEHYYRAMSSWAVLLAATGFKIDAPRRTLSFAPAVGGPFRAPWFAATGWGRFEQADGRFRLQCDSGQVSFRSLRLKLPCRPAAARLAGRKLAAKVTAKGDAVTLTMARSVTVKEGQVLVVE